MDGNIAITMKRGDEGWGKKKPEVEKKQG